MFTVQLQWKFTTQDHIMASHRLPTRRCRHPTFTAGERQEQPAWRHLQHHCRHAGCVGRTGHEPLLAVADAVTRAVEQPQHLLPAAADLHRQSSQGWVLRGLLGRCTGGRNGRCRDRASSSSRGGAGSGGRSSDRRCWATLGGLSTWRRCRRCLQLVLIIIRPWAAVKKAVFRSFALLLYDGLQEGRACSLENNRLLFGTL